MAGGFQNVEQIGSGIYRATDAGGQSFIVHGQPGEDLFNRYTSSKAPIGPPPPPEPTAAVGGMPVTKLANGGVSVPLSQVRQNWKAHEPPPETQQASVSTAPGAAAPTTTDTQAPPAAQQQGGPLGYTMKGVDPITGKEVAGQGIRMPDGSIGIYRPPVAGSAGGLTKLGKEALRNSAEAEQEHAKQLGIVEEARASGTDAAIQEANEREAYLSEQRTQLQLQQQQQQDDNDKIQKQVGDLQAKYDKARDDFMNSKVDPDAYMKGGKGAVGVFSALGMALGAFGAALARTPNFAQEFVQSQIDRNIRAQETQIQVKGRAADNMLADLTRSTGSLQNGKLAMKQLLTERAAIEAQQIGASSKSQGIASKAKEVSAALAADAALQDNARRQGMLEHVMSSRLYYAPGSPGRSGGFITPTQEQVAAGQQMGLDIRKQALAEAKAGEGAGKDKVGFRGTASIAAARVARGAVAEMAEAMGMKRGPDGKYEPPSWSSVAASHIPKSDTKQKLDALHETLPSEINKAQTGGTTTEGGMAAMHDQINALKTPGDYAAFINHYDHTMAEVERQQRLTAGSVHNTGGEAAEEAEHR